MAVVEAGAVRPTVALDDAGALEVGDGSGAGPFAAAAATALVSAPSVLPIFLPLTFTVGVPLTPSWLDRSVCAATSALCFSEAMHASNVVAAEALMPMAVP